ncbi:PCYCGC domain-containing protein (plasmid) [Priestia megaterium]|uniref:PCYCGC domain-containing protein n=1 Tax=Priestia TaxID=2800373 RepID=UPI001F251904|nr:MULTISPECIES: PCYCGC domain-containing protein [Priestia]MCW1048944.1 PCYCGC domain-containing protein [Priestia sp. JV24]
MFKKLLFLSAVLIITTIWVILPNANIGKDAQINNNTADASEDVREETESQTLPTFLSEKPDNIKIVYTEVSKNKKLLENIPCYCGSGEAEGHKSNYDCFIKENKDNGRVVWDDHATKSRICPNIASQAIVDYNDGKSIKEIRQGVEDKFKEGYPNPTPTPEV